MDFPKIDGTVLSDVHTSLEPFASTSFQNERTFRSRFEYMFQLDAEMEHSTSEDDSDDDLCLARTKEKNDVIIIEHALETSISDVGLQVWNGALLMCDYILLNAQYFKNSIVLDLGAGVGLTSVLLSRLGAKVLATDHDITALNILKRNSALNDLNLTSIFPLYLNWCQNEPKVDENDFSWNRTHLSSLSNCNYIIAADVVYDTELNKFLFDTVEKFYGTDTIEIVFTVEQRLNFSVDTMCVCAPAYDNFQNWLDKLKEFDWSVNQISLQSIPQRFKGYSRNGFMELWTLRKI